ncbi:DPOD polymerase, partial [Atrichornis clamosus]|nr:DPOD polymerase [Atrichornis clamosus]
PVPPRGFLGAPDAISGRPAPVPGVPGVFPEPQRDPVIAVAAAVLQQGAREPFVRAVFSLLSCAPLRGAAVRSFGTERELL